VQTCLTFRQALKLGAHVRKGEKGTTVVYADRFIPYRERTRAAETGGEPEAIPFLKRFTVFNADQCEDLPAELAPAPAPLAENLILPQAEALIRATGADIRIGGTMSGAAPVTELMADGAVKVYRLEKGGGRRHLDVVRARDIEGAVAEPRPLRRFRFIIVCARRIVRGNDRRLRLRGAVDRADGAARRLSRQLARGAARGQPRDYPRGQRRVESGRLSARFP
jgi:hypothetical protein